MNDLPTYNFSGDNCIGCGVSGCDGKAGCSYYEGKFDTLMGSPLKELDRITDTISSDKK